MNELRAAVNRAPSRLSYRHSDLDLVRDEKGRPVWNTANAVSLVTEHEDWQGVLAHDKFSARHLLLRPIPGSTEAAFEPREMTDADLTAAVVWFNRNGFPRATRNVVTDAVLAVAARSIINSCRHYLESLSWTGQPRISSWLRTYLGADDTLYVQEAGRRWLISAVARALRPAC